MLARPGVPVKAPRAECRRTRTASWGWRGSPGLRMDPEPGPADVLAWLRPSREPVPRGHRRGAGRRGIGLLRAAASKLPQTLPGRVIPVSRRPVPPSRRSSRRATFGREGLHPAQEDGATCHETSVLVCGCTGARVRWPGRTKWTVGASPRRVSPVTSPSFPHRRASGGLVPP
jgi:hypothetical protein